MLLKHNNNDRPSLYRIRAKGSLERTWADRLDGMVITTIRKANRDVETTIEGYVADQAALSGLLNALSDLCLTLLSVECLDEKSEHEQNRT